ncbi:MAG TPA: hypothetical protein VGI74_22345 [Streptosporangiaceae bacterium]
MDQQGAIAAFDFNTGELVYSRVLDSPAGFAFTEGHIFVTSMHGSRVLVLDSRFGLVDSLATTLMNDLHSITPSPDGFLITCCGTDSVLEVTPDGEPLWTWLACEHGFQQTPLGQSMQIDRQHDYRSTVIDTRDQSTHCNSALATKHDGRDVVLVTLFHQGQLIAIDKRTGKHSALVHGMRNPHSIRRRAGGWVLSEARPGAAVLLDEDFWIADVIEKDFNWVQDTLPLDDEGQLIIADANNSRFVLWDIANGRQVREIGYSRDWDIYQVEVAGPVWEKRFRNAGGLDSARHTSNST